MRACIALNSDYPDAQNILGLLLQRKGDVEAAVAAFREAAKLRPTTLIRTIISAWPSCRVETATEPSASFRQPCGCARTTVDTSGIWVQLTFKLQTSIPPRLSFKSTETLTARPTLHYGLGLALKLKDKLPEAVAEFRKAAELDPGQADAHYTWA